MSVISITLKAIDEYSGTVTSLNQGFELLGKGLSALKIAADLAFSAIGAGLDFAGALNELAKLGGAFDEQRNQFENLATSYELNGQEIIDIVKRTSSNTVSEFNSIVVATKAVAAGLSGKELEDALAYIKRWSEATGESFTAVAERVFTSLSSGRYSVLRQMGLVIENGATLNEVTAAMTEGLKRFGDTGFNAADKMDALAASTDDFWRKVGQSINQSATYQAIIGSISDSFVALVNAFDSRPLTAFIDLVGNIAAEFASHMIYMLTGVSNFKEVFKNIFSGNERDLQLAINKVAELFGVLDELNKYISTVTSSGAKDTVSAAERMKVVFAEVVRSIGNGFADLAIYVASAYNTALVKASELLQWLGDKAGAVLQTLVSFSKASAEIILSSVEVVLNIFDIAYSAIQKFVSSAVNVLVGTFLNTIKSAIDTVANSMALTGLVDQLVQSSVVLRNLFGDGAGAIEAMSRAVAAAEQGVKTFQSSLTGIDVESIMSTLRSNVMGYLDSAGAAADGLKEKFYGASYALSYMQFDLSALDIVKSVFNTKIDDIISSVAKKFGYLGGLAGNALGALGKATVDSFFTPEYMQFTGEDKKTSGFFTPEYMQFSGANEDPPDLIDDAALKRWSAEQDKLQEEALSKYRLPQGVDTAGIYKDAQQGMQKSALDAAKKGMQGAAKDAGQNASKVIQNAIDTTKQIYNDPWKDIAKPMVEPLLGMNPLDYAKLGTWQQNEIKAQVDYAEGMIRDRMVFEYDMRMNEREAMYQLELKYDPIRRMQQFFANANWPAEMDAFMRVIFSWLINIANTERLPMAITTR